MLVPPPPVYNVDFATQGPWRLERSVAGPPNGLDCVFHCAASDPYRWNGHISNCDHSRTQKKSLKFSE